jgi:hypothetical protein
MQNNTTISNELEDNFLTSEQEHQNIVLSDDVASDAVSIPRVLPIVPFVRILSNSDPSDCPFDRYMMSRKMAELEYSKDKKGGNVIGLQVLLRSCPQCERLYIDQSQLLGLKKAGLDISGFDIIGSAQFPRTKGYEKWHPEAVKKHVAAVAAPIPAPKKARKPSVKKTKVS